MATAKSGDTVRIHYTGTLEDGSVFDSSEGRDPLSFELGSGQIIPGLDTGLNGMAVGEKRTVTVAPERSALRCHTSEIDIPPAGASSAATLPGSTAKASSVPCWKTSYQPPIFKDGTSISSRRASESNTSQ